MSRKDKPSKIRRNDPCPCGSGKKYKQCCLLKEMDAAQERRAAGSAMPVKGVPDIPPPPPPTILPDRQTAREDPFAPLWDEFNNADYSDKIAWIYRTLDDEEIELDGQLVFDLFEELNRDCNKHDDRARFNEMAEHLRQTRAELYAEEQSYLLGWMIENAYAAGRQDDIARYFLEFSEIADRDIDLYFRALVQVEYHGDLELLTEAVDIAWFRIRDSRDVTQWGIDEFAHKATDFHVFHFLESNPQARGDEPELLDRLSIYDDAEPDVDRLRHYLDWVTGRRAANWTEADFAHRNEQFHDNLGQLSLQFLGYLRHDQQMAFSKAELAREALVHYFVRRHQGELKLEEGKPKIRHPLCPDDKTLDRYLGELMGFLNRQDFKVVAQFETIPLWLKFLLDRGLLTNTIRMRILEELRPLHKMLLKIYRNDPIDPALFTALEDWPYLM